MDCEKIKAIQAEKKELMEYIRRYQKAMDENVEKLKKLDREMELLLTPCLPGLEEDKDA